MAKVLVVDHQRSARRSLVQSLGECGYDVGDVTSGKAALEIASEETFDVILLNVEMPGMDGWEVLTQLKNDRPTRKIPVIMLDSYLSAQNEATALRLGAAHILTKPCRAETLARTVRVVLREAESVSQAPGPATEKAGEPPPIPSKAPQPKDVIGTGGKFLPLEKLLGGGIPLESLTMIEGVSEEIDSSVCQYLTYGALSDGRKVAYFASENSSPSLAEQMGSIGLPVGGLVEEGLLNIYPRQRHTTHDDPDSLLVELAAAVKDVPSSYDLVVVDSISDLAVVAEDRSIIGFFSSCQRLCAEGRTIIVAVQSSAFVSNMLARLHGLCHAHISLEVQMVRQNFWNMLKVAKVRKVDLRRDNSLSFQIDPEIGIRILPMGQIKA